MRIEHGSISTGTLKTTDLIAAFCVALKRYDEKRYRHIMLAWAEDISTDESMDDGTWADTLGDLLNDLESALEEVVAEADEPTYFGTLEGDGADFGFWPLDEEHIWSVTNGNKV